LGSDTYEIIDLFEIDTFNSPYWVRRGN